VRRSRWDSQGQPAWISTGAAGDKHDFTWVGATIQISPTPYPHRSGACSSKRGTEDTAGEGVSCYSTRNVPPAVEPGRRTGHAFQTLRDRSCCLASVLISRIILPITLL